MNGLSLERWSWASIGVNVALGLLNLGIAAASGSLAVAAETVHNLVDLAASVAVLIGLKLSQRSSKAFPYGLYKVENVVAAGVGVLILFTGYEIVREALLTPNRETTVSSWMLGGVALAALVPLAFSRLELRAGRAANSPSLIASAQEYRTHVFSSGAVLAALVGQLLGVRLDRLAALAVVVFIAKTGWDLLRDGMRVLLDASLDVGTLAQVRQIVEADPAVAQVTGLTGRNSGRYRFLEADVALRVGDLAKAHIVSLRIEQAIRERVPHVERALIHYEPAARTHVRYAVPLADPQGRLSEHFGEAPHFALVTVRLADGTIEEQQVVANPHREEPKAKGILVAEWLVAQKVDRVLLKQSLQGKGPEYVFADAGVEMEIVAADSLDQALKELAR